MVWCHTCHCPARVPGSGGDDAAQVAFERGLRGLTWCDDLT
jgi:hypothetical protein